MLSRTESLEEPEMTTSRRFHRQIRSHVCRQRPIRRLRWWQGVDRMLDRPLIAALEGCSTRWDQNMFNRGARAVVDEALAAQSHPARVKAVGGWVNGGIPLGWSVGGFVSESSVTA